MYLMSIPLLARARSFAPIAPKKSRLAALGCVMLLPLAPLEASTIVSTFGPAGSLYETGGFPLPVGNATFGSNNLNVSTATRFTIPTGVWDVTEVDVPVENVTAPADALFIIANDNAGQPGAFDWISSVLTGIPAANSSCCAVTTVDIAPSTLLLSSFESTTYWLIVAPGNELNTDQWMLSPQSGTIAYQNNSSQTWFSVGLSSNVGAFSIEGTNELAPEPGSAILMASALAGLAALCIRRKPIPM